MSTVQPPQPTSRRRARSRPGLIAALAPVVVSVLAAVTGRAAPALEPKEPHAAGEQRPSAALSSAYDEEVAQRRARFAAEQAKPQSPAAVVPLMGLGELWEHADDRAAVLRLVTDASQPGPAIAPPVRAYALALQRALLLHQGELRGAAAITRELGVVQSFAVVGPFDNDGRRGHAATYGPEQDAVAPSLDTRYEGKSPALPLRWRVVPESGLGRDGTVPLDAWLRPDTQGTAYALVYVRSDRQQPVALRLGTTGAVKVFVNRGAPVIDRDVYRALHLDQEVAGATLLAGWNRVLVKVSATEGRWAFTLRLTAPDGRALTGITTSANPPSLAWPLPRAVPYAGPRPLHLLDGLQARVPKAAPGLKPGTPAAAARSQALLDLALYLHHVQPGDPEKHEDEQLAAEAAQLMPSQRAYRIWALVTTEANDQRRVLEAGLRLSAQPQAPVAPGPASAVATPAPPIPDDPAERARLLLEIGRIYDEGQRQRQAEEAFREAARLAPRLYRAEISLAQIQAARGLLAEAERLLREVQGRHPALRALRGLADIEGRTGRAAEAAASWRRLLELSRDDGEAQRQLLAHARARGETDEALSWLDRISEARPDEVWPLRERAELLEGAGRFEQALVLVSGATEQLGGDPDWHQLRGRLLVRLGRAELAVQAYRRALELKPQNPALRQYLAWLDPQARSGDDLQRQFRVEVPPLLKLPREKPKAGDAARVLLDQKVTRVHRNGLSEVFTQRVIEILDERGAREYDDLAVRFTPDTQSVQVKSAKIYKATGEIQERIAEDESNVSEPWYGLYYDVHAVTLRFDGLRPGDVIAVEYVLADVGRRNLLSEYFGDLHFLQEEIPRLDSRYVLVVPSEDLARRPLYFNNPGAGPGGKPASALSVARTDEKKGADTIISYRATQVPKLVSEPGMPGYSEVVPYIHVSTYKSWEDVATWYTGLVAEQLVPSAEITRAARAAVASIPASDELGRIKALYNEVVKRTRYVGLEFGIHGYKPYKVSQVFQRKFGDCKDKASLLKVMLKEVGIDSTLVLARTRRNGDIVAEPASLALFDHAIVYVPKFDLYLDGTAEFSGSMELPAQDQDIVVLLVSDPRPPFSGKGHLTRTPVLPAERSTVTRRLEVQLGASGEARVKDELRVSGEQAARWREHYQSQGTQKERYEKAWNDTFPGAKALRVVLPGIGDLEKAVQISGEVEVPGWGRPQGGAGSASELTLKPLGRDPDLLRSYARLSSRRYDLVLGFPFINREEVVVHLPPALRVHRLPAARTIETPFGRFTLTATEQRGATGSVTIKSDLRIDRHRIAQADYAAFRRFCTEVDAAVAQELVVGRE